VALDLSGAQTAMEGLLLDRGVVYDDIGGVDDLLLDEDTGELTADPDDADAQIWAGSVAVTANDGRSLPGVDASKLPPVTGTHRGLLPMRAPALRKGNVLVMTRSRDPQMLGRRFVVTGEATAGTFALLRAVGLDPA
jgi:hypothetical protein